VTKTGISGHRNDRNAGVQKDFARLFAALAAPPVK